MATDYTSFNIAICEWLGLDPTNVESFMITADGNETTIIARLVVFPNAPEGPDEILTELRKFRVCPYDEETTDAPR